MSTTATTMLNVKVPTDLKRQVQAFAADFGIPVSAIVNNALRHVVAEREVTFAKPLVPNAKTAKELREARADILAGRNLSPVFHDAEDFLLDLMK